MGNKLSRRDALRRLSAGVVLPAAAVPVAAAGEAAPPPAAAEQAPGTCVLLPQAVEGPYYFDPKLVRSDISEGKPGAALKLILRVIEAGPCKPLPGIRVDVWHADAGGIYSGYDRQGDDGRASTTGQKYLRGTQISDADGIVTFRSVYPGWYPGRTPHIHVKAFLDATSLVTGQIYFPDDVSAKIYQTRERYSARPRADTTNGTDFIFKAGQREGGGTVLSVSEEGGEIVAALLIAVDKSGAAARQAAGFGGFLKRILGQ